MRGPRGKDAFARFFASKNAFGVTSYEQLTPAMKKQLLYSSMLDNAMLASMLSNVKADDNNVSRGVAVKHASNISVIDSITTIYNGALMPQGNTYWDAYRTRGINVVYDATKPMIVHFTREQMLNNNITTTGTDCDFSIIRGEKVGTNIANSDRTEGMLSHEETYESVPDAAGEGWNKLYDSAPVTLPGEEHLYTIQNPGDGEAESYRIVFGVSKDARAGYRVVDSREAGSVSVPTSMYRLENGCYVYSGRLMDLKPAENGTEYDYREEQVDPDDPSVYLNPSKQTKGEENQSQGSEKSEEEDRDKTDRKKDADEEKDTGKDRSSRRYENRRYHNGSRYQQPPDRYNLQPPGEPD